MSILFLSKTSLSINPEVILQWINESCIGGDCGLLSTGIWITFHVSGDMSPGRMDIRCTLHQMSKYNYSLYVPDLGSYLENLFQSFKYNI